MIVPNKILENRGIKCKTFMIGLLRYSQAHKPMALQRLKERSDIVQINMPCKSMTSKGIQMVVYFEVKEPLWAAHGSEW